jgi:hypothetical protein
MIEIAIRPYAATLFLTTSQDEYLEKRRKYTDVAVDLTGTGGITSGYEDDEVFVVGLFTATAQTLVHELSHVVIRTLCRVGIPINIETSEAFTYLLDDLYSECSAALTKEISSSLVLAGNGAIAGQQFQD